MAELSRAIAQLMRERERAQPSPVSSVSPDTPKLRAVLDAVREKVAPGERALADAFVRQLFDKTGAELLDRDDVPQLTPLALATFRFVLERMTEEPRVAVFDPDLIHEGWETPCSVVQTLLRDRPFIVDTIQDCLREAGCTVQRLLHPLLAVERDARGAVLAIAAPGALGRRESLVHVEVDRVADPDGLAALLVRHLGDLVLATDDYPAMRAKAEQIAETLRTPSLPRPWNLDVDDIAAFIDWLGEKTFVFLGYREYQFAGQGSERTAAVRRGTGLGILRKEDRSTFAQPRVLPEVLRRRLNEPPLLIVSKTNAESPIHRRAPMDYIGIKEIDAAGIVVGERRFLGLFTSKAYAEESASLPLLRRKLAAILEAEAVIDESHDYKAIVSIFNSVPKTELLAASPTELRAEIKAIRAAEGGTDVVVLQRPDSLGRGLFVIVIVPRSRFSDELYRGAATVLHEAVGATAVLEQRVVLDDSDQVRLHFYFGVGPEHAGGAPNEELRSRVGNLLRTWDDRLREALPEHFSREQTRALAARYAAAFPGSYKAATDVATAIRDVRCVEDLLLTRTPQVDVSNDARFTRLKLYLLQEELVLSDFLPVLENLGLKVFAEEPLALTVSESGAVRIQTFFVQDTSGALLDIEAVAPLLKPALLMLHAGRLDNDRLNALIVRAGLAWPQVDLLRTYVNHGSQIGAAPSRGALLHAVADYPASARLLWEYFDAKFDPLKPAAARDREAQALPDIERRFVASLEAVQSIADDRMLRAIFGAMAATTRTNFYRPPADEAGSNGAGPERAAVAVKVESARIPHLRRPRPLYEVYVHGPLVEGIHLRGSKVSRGGVRLSDRPDDFRTEILGLMNTQMVKNAVIIPAGAKGGFIVKRRAGAAVGNAQVIAAYRAFMSALLDVTDNIEQGRLVPPAGVLAYDDPDPYLVVAADKGTSAFSDIANEIAARYRFWLGDAFASGGEFGYDHKKEGITARGAWECVRRHFREMGRDADRDAITVIGIGDMSGDVFGNGLLLSRRFSLHAAFNHQHIFLDPNPDPPRSFAERERLFRLPRSSWADYSTAALSEGGGVFLRGAKTIALSAPSRAMLGIDSDSLSGEELVRAILRMDVDLLWNGGIGTYVKAADETDAEVGDSSNDAVRIVAGELRVKVVAEGGNLGFTQRGRIEYAQRGGRINSDAIDNSAGVDMSDHEVNLKIAVGSALEAGNLSVEERNQLLGELAPDVSRRVLAHNQRQARALSLDQQRSQRHVNDFVEWMMQLEGDGVLERHREALPDRETLRNRRGAFLGLARPELAVLLAQTKLWLQHRLLTSPLPDDLFFERYLRGYFPEVINQRFGQGVRSHRLRRELISVELANAIIDVMGVPFVARVSRDTGTDAVAVARAWAVAVTVSGAGDVWADITNADPALPVAAEAHCWFVLESAIERATKWIVETQPAEEPTTDLDTRLVPATDELLGNLSKLLPPAAQEKLSATIDALAGSGTPRPLAARIAALARLAEVFEIEHIAAEVNASRLLVAELYYRAADLVDLDWVRQQLSDLPAEDRWERRALEGLNEGLLYARRQLTRNILGGVEGGGVDDRMRAYGTQYDAPLAKVRAVINDVKSAPRVTLAALLVVMRELGRLVGGAV